MCSDFKAAIDAASIRNPSPSPVGNMRRSPNDYRYDSLRFCIVVKSTPEPYSEIQLFMAPISYILGGMLRGSFCDKPCIWQSLRAPTVWGLREQEPPTVGSRIAERTLNKTTNSGLRPETLIVLRGSGMPVVSQVSGAYLNIPKLYMPLDWIPSGASRAT